MDYLFLKLLHVLSNYLWVGGLISTSFCSRFSIDRKFTQKIYLYFQASGLFGALFFGGLLLVFSPNVNFKEPWLHLKLTAVTLLAAFDLIYLRRCIFHGKMISRWAIGVWVGLVLTILISIYIWKPLI